MKKTFHDWNFEYPILRRPFASLDFQDGTFEVTPKGTMFFWQMDFRITSRSGYEITLDKSTFVLVRKHSLQSFAKEMKELFGIRSLCQWLKIPTQVRLSYIFRCENVVPASGNGGAVVNIWDDRNCWFPQNPITETTPWIRQSFEFTTGSKTNDERNKSYVKLYLLLSSGTVWFDGVALSEVQ